MNKQNKQEQWPRLTAYLEIPHALLNTLNKKEVRWLRLHAHECKSTAMWMHLYFPHRPQETRRSSSPSSTEFLTWYPVQLKHLPLDNKSKQQHLNNLWGIRQPEIGRGNFANSFLCHFLNLPLTGELIWAWELPITSKKALCSHDCFGAMGQGKS